MDDPKTTAATFASYLPRLARTWERESPDARARELDGSLVSVDLSGFTALSERLAAHGRAGAEELILLISGVFEGLIGIAERHGGDVLKFRGDALLILFRDAGHEPRACVAAAEMQWFLERAGPTRSSAGDVRLRMATGIYSGPCHVYLVGSSHHELLFTGPATSETARLEDAAEAGEIVVSARTAEALDPAWVAAARGGDALLGLPEDAEAPPSPEAEPDPPDADLEAYVPAPIRAHLAGDAAEGEHRQAAVAFLRFGGTDELLLREGPGAVLAQLDLLGRVVGETADEYGITWLESDIDAGGGKLYLTAGAPSSAGDDEERMLRAVRAILDADHGPELRAGVNRGPVFAGVIGSVARRTYAVMGDTVNLAARLTGRAGPGELYATADVLERSRTLFESSHQPYLMKGKERPVTAFRVGAVAGAREEEVDTALPLVGREEELAALTTAVNAARMRQLQVVELVGEPGIGKSRLVRELLASAVGFQQLVVRCERYESSHPYFAFRSVLRTLAGIRPEQPPEEAGAQLAAWVGPTMPDLAPWLPLLAVPFDATVPPTPEVEALDPTLRRDRLHDVVDAFLSRVLMMPTLLVFEDAHWMDDASQFLLRHLAAASAPRPWLVCVSRRPEGEAVVANGCGTRLELRPLAGEEVARLALAASADSPFAEADLEAVAQRSGGNPLFVRELVAAARERGAVADLPETVETLITARLDRLDPADRLLLRYASVIGPSFDLATLGEILDGETAAGTERWERLSEFVGWDGVDALRFRHDLFRAVAYAGLSFRRRRTIHRRLGEALERRVSDPTGESAGLLALHFAEAGEYERAWRYAVAAGRRAQERYANVVAAELYGRALGAAGQLPELPAAEVADVLESLGDVSGLFGRYEQAADAYRRARALRAGDAPAEARLHRKEGAILQHEGRYEEALRAYDAGIELALPHEAETPGVLGELELACSGLRFRVGDYEDAVAWAERAQAHAEAAGDRRSLAHAHYLRGTALAVGLGRADEAGSLRTALAAFEELDDHVGSGNALNNLGIVDYYAGRWDDARAHWRRSREEKHRAGDVVSEAIGANNEGEILSDQGKLDEAIALFEEALRVHRAAGYAVGAAVDLANLGRAAARAGRFEEAHARLGEALAAFREMGSQSFVHETSARIAEARMLAGEHREAHAAATALLGEVESEVLRALLERVAGYAALQGRDPSAARAHLERGLAHARAAAAPFEEALTLQALAEVERRDGGDPAPLEAEARALLDGLGVVATPRVPLP